VGSGAKPRPPNDLVHFIGLRCALVATCYPKIHLFNKSFYDCFYIITSELISWHCNFYSINIFKCNARIAVIYHDMSISILRVHHTDYSFSLRGFSANVSTSDDSDRALQICFSTAMTSNASVLSSPDVDLVSVLINFSLLCERSLHADVTGKNI
jgi:hypothetical protein